MRSDTVKKGVQQAPHRSLFNALGMTEEELEQIKHSAKVLRDFIADVVAND